MNTKNFVLLCAATLLSGCASQYVYRPDASAASLQIAGNSRQFFVESYQNLACAIDDNGIRVATFFGPTADVADHEQGKAVAVPPGKEMLLTFRYIDAKVGQNRMCNLMVAFTPETRGRYKAYFKVEPEVTGCGVSLRQEGEGEAKEVSSFHLADRVCLSGKDVGPINGRAQRLKWEVQVIRLR